MKLKTKYIVLIYAMAIIGFAIAKHNNAISQFVQFWQLMFFISMPLLAYHSFQKVADTLKLNENKFSHEIKLYTDQIRKETLAYLIADVLNNTLKVGRTDLNLNKAANEILEIVKGMHGADAPIIFLSLQHAYEKARVPLNEVQKAKLEASINQYINDEKTNNQ